MCRVLVIEDSNVTRMLIASLLKHLGHSVVEAGDGLKAMRAFVPGTIDLVITDIIMPDQEGVETIRQIRQLDEAVPILAMSGSDSQLGAMDYLSMTLAFGANDTLRKPFSLDALVAKLEGLLPVAAA